MRSRLNGAIVVLCHRGIGDFVRSHTLISLIAARHPGRPIDVVTTPIAVALAQFMPNVRSGYGFETRHNRLGIAERWRLATVLRDAGYDTAVVVHSTFKSALVVALARIPERIGWFGQFRYPLINRPIFWTSGSQRQLDDMVPLALDPGEALPSELPLPRLNVPQSQVRALLARMRVPDSSQPVIAMVPSNAEDSRGWPLENFIELARMCAGRGWRVWLLGHSRERAAAEAIGRLVPAVNLTGGSLTDATVQIAAASALVAADGGLVHVGAALGKPVVAIYGVTDPWLWGPINPQVRFVLPDGYHADRRLLARYGGGRFEWPPAGARAVRGIAPERVMAQLDQCVENSSRDLAEVSTA